MEFPELGEHCHVSTCRQLDFLPVKCDSCMKILCRNHIAYNDHGCDGANRKDVQVPVCPLCNQPIPIARGELPDIKVGQHIDRDCSDPAAKRNRIYTNACSLKRCKKAELVPIRCQDCCRNFCLKHRHPVDHFCGDVSKLKAPPHSRQASSGASRLLQPSISQDEALARALQMSLSTGSTGAPAGAGVGAGTQEEQDAALAAAIAQSEREFAQRQRQDQARNRRATTASSGQRSGGDSCSLS